MLLPDGFGRRAAVYALGHNFHISRTGGREMTLSIRETDKIVPEYSMTGDLLSHRRCGLQYRLYNRGALPPSKPVQQWFGEFIHGVMEEAYYRWSAGTIPLEFPWHWHVIQPIEIDVHTMLLAKGLQAPPGLFRRYNEAGDPRLQRRLASYRAEAALNTWASHLFPLVQAAEVRLKGSRLIPHIIDASRAWATRYTVTGVVDVLSSVALREADESNRIVAELMNDPFIRSELASGATFDVIVDYKGMRRPVPGDAAWTEQAWQLRTYAWLRQQQVPDRRVIAGVLLYLNELIPARADLLELVGDSTGNGGRQTDLPASGADLQDLQMLQEALAAATRRRDPDLELLEEYEAADNQVSETLRIARSFRLVEMNEASIAEALDGFDRTVADIERCVYQESTTGDVQDSWPAYFERRTCVACDFKYQCPTGRALGEIPAVP